MEGSRRSQHVGQEDSDRGHGAASPAEIPTPGWRDILVRTKNAISRDNISIIAGGTAFFLLVGLVPGLAALISIYGLFANPADIQAQFDALSTMMPAEVRTILETQMTQISTQHHAAGIAALVSILLALWGGAAALKTAMSALNIIYHEKEKRGYVRLTLTALGLTITFIFLGVVSIGLIVALPPLLAHLGLGDAARTTVSLLRWPFLLVVALIGLGILYRYGPSREKPQWKWVTPGALSATVLWVLGSGLFAFYAQHFGHYNKTYGSLGAIVVLMLWLYLSAFALLLGAVINAQSELQTAQDTTTGGPEPLGRRGAFVADDVASSVHEQPFKESRPK
jgi:membrane protein